MKKVEYDRDGAKQHNWRNGMSVHATSYIYITCPFCGAETRAYIWSLAGSGKKCICGAMHTGFGLTVPVKTKDNAGQSK